MVMVVVLKRSQVRARLADAFGEAQPPANITLSRKPDIKSLCAIQATLEALEKDLYP